MCQDSEGVQSDPKRAKKLYNEVVPKAVDEYLEFIEKSKSQNELQKLMNPVWHVHNGKIPTENFIMSFSMLLNLVETSNADSKELLWKFVKKYKKDISESNYPIFDNLIDNFNKKEKIWIKKLIEFEFNYLEFMGFGIDLSECALTGTTDSLEWVSPKSGRAVNSKAGKKWSKKLLKLPPFLLDKKIDADKNDLIDGLNLTGHFLKKQIYSDLNKDLPSSRKKIIDSLKN